VIDEFGENVTAHLMAMVNPTRPAAGAYAELLVLSENCVAPPRLRLA
jgi:hypothetical protein